jgi:hypothetical protein
MVFTCFIKAVFLPHKSATQETTLSAWLGPPVSILCETTPSTKHKIARDDDSKSDPMRLDDGNT